MLDLLRLIIVQFSLRTRVQWSVVRLHVGHVQVSAQLLNNLQSALDKTVKESTVRMSSNVLISSPVSVMPLGDTTETALQVG